MSTKYPPNYPITKVYVISDPQKCSPNDELLLRSKDKDSDCDLLKEVGMFKKNTRYLCFSRAFNKDAQNNNVVVAIQMISEKEQLPIGFVPIEKTLDTAEKATKKKTICIKMAERNSALEAISNIVLYTKVRRPDPGWSAIGELNGIFICVKSSKIPPESQVFRHASPNDAKNSQAKNQLLRQAPPPPNKPTPVPRSKTEYGTLNPLHNIEFKLNPNNVAQQNNTNLAPSVSFRSLNDIENEFQYNFNLERSVLCK